MAIACLNFRLLHKFPHAQLHSLIPAFCTNSWDHVHDSLFFKDSSMRSLLKEPSKRFILLKYNRSAEFLRQRLLALWISVAQTNHQLFSDFVEISVDLYKLQMYFAEERPLFLELGALVIGFDKATPNYHIALHIPHQIYLQYPPHELA